MLKKKIISSNKFLELKIGFSKNQFWKKFLCRKCFLTEPNSANEVFPI